MASSPPPCHSQILPIEEEPPHSILLFRPTGRRTPSFSSSGSWDSSFGSSSLSLYEEFPPFSPGSPLKFKGVPFSWEQIPGIPKHQLSKKKHPSGQHLPLPPAGTPTSTSDPAAKKLLHLQDQEISPKKPTRFQRDPFFAALVECSKDDDDDILKGSSKITRTLSDRFGLINMYTSCKRTCAVSESIVHLPRKHNYLDLNHRGSNKFPTAE